MDKPYRECVVAVVSFDMKTFLVGERSNQLTAWQFPQGGIESGETAEQAVMRELKEEVGTNQATIIKKAREPICYDFPVDLLAPIAKHYRGQAQSWFLLQFASDAQPDLELAEDEFANLAFWPIDKILSNVVNWKRPAYELGLRALGL